MKKIFSIFVLISLFSFIGIAQTSLTYNLTMQLSGFHNPIWSTFFTNASTGYAVGNNGIIVKTINGGTTWTQQSGGTTNHLYSVFFVNANIGWIVGSNCTILKTTNGGSSWIQQSGGLFNDHFNSVFFTTENTGYIVTTKGSILKTTDGGSTWSNQRNQYNPFLFSVFFTDTNTGYAIGGSGTNGTTPSVMKILKTANGGTLWTEITNGVTDGVLKSVYFATSTTGYAVGIRNNGNSAILKTTDGGTTWIASTIPTAQYLRSVYFIDANTGFCTGDGGVIFRTTNGGITWTDISESTMKQRNQALYSSYFINSNLGWIACSNGSIIKYTSSSSSGTIQLPTLATTAASSVTNSSAISGGNISSDGGAPITSRGVCWSTTPNPTIANNKTYNGTGTGTYTSTITGLQGYRSYYARAYATNSAGTAYGNQVMFTCKRDLEVDNLFAHQEIFEDSSKNQLTKIRITFFVSRPELVNSINVRIGTTPETDEIFNGKVTFEMIGTSYYALFNGIYTKLVADKVVIFWFGDKSKYKVAKYVSIEALENNGTLSNASYTFLRNF